MKKLSNPEPRDLCISDCNEKALQRAMLKQSIDGNLSNLDDGTSIEWIDYELPVEFTNNSRKQSIDLLVETTMVGLYYVKQNTTVTKKTALMMQN